MRAILLLCATLAALPATAAPSLCGHLPTTGKVAAAGPDDVQPARPRPNRSLGCAPGFSLDLMARPAACRRAAQIAVDGNPRAACSARLALGPVADVPAQHRPTRSCPSGAITTVIRLEGVNVGLADVALTTASPGVTLATLDEDSKGLDVAQRPAAQGCFAYECRLVRFTAAADAMDVARLELRIADGDRLIVPVAMTAHCDDAMARPVPAGPRRIIASPPGR